jgi:hypothetical protein
MKLASTKSTRRKTRGSLSACEVSWRRRREILGLLAKDLPAVTFFRSGLCVQRQAAAVRMFLRFFGLGVVSREVSGRHVQ